MNKDLCPRCSGKEFWNIRRGKLKCKNCRYEFKVKRYPLNLSKYEWKKFLKWFIISGRVRMITGETDMSEYKVLQCSSLVRQVISKDIPENF